MNISSTVKCNEKYYDGDFYQHCENMVIIGEDICHDCKIKNLKKELIKLKQDNEVLLECVSFYAEKNNWRVSETVVHTWVDVIRSDDIDKEAMEDSKLCKMYGGKKAREALAKLESKS